MYDIHMLIPASQWPSFGCGAFLVRFGWRELFCNSLCSAIRTSIDTTCWKSPATFLITKTLPISVIKLQDGIARVFNCGSHCAVWPHSPRKLSSLKGRQETNPWTTEYRHKVVSNRSVTAEPFCQVGQNQYFAIAGMSIHGQQWGSVVGYKDLCKSWDPIAVEW